MIYFQAPNDLCKRGRQILLGLGHRRNVKRMYLREVGLPYLPCMSVELSDDLLAFGGCFR